EWEDFYNFHRPHGALGGQTPYERLRERRGPGREWTPSAAQLAGATLWVLLATMSIAVVLVATALEHWRSRIGAGMHRLGALMSGWE
ncbi:MAG TPA: hypothetical protein VFM40_09185, partial [Actinomycetota bacterium]|nr:hypothetical protein [Actinomycetota bacterium]